MITVCHSVVNYFLGKYIIFLVDKKGEGSIVSVTISLG